MSIKAALVTELPYLRRYARAITGSQPLGDAAVREVLEALLEAPSEFDTDQPVRLELYRIFHRLWDPETVAAFASSTPTSKLDVSARQALLLTAVEGFSVSETADILGSSSADVTNHLERAREAISNLLLSSVMIIEDEAIIAMHIKAIVTEIGHSVVGIARTHSEAVAMAKATSPELVLADISLADGSSGIDAVKDILDDIDVPVIFVTAFPERLLTGERPEPTYLITKPFEPAVLTATIAQALMFDREGAAKAQGIAA
jgi:CheY-like chemotaxis protein